MADQPIDCGLVEELLAVLDDTGDPAGIGPQDEGQVEPGRAALQLEQPQIQAREIQLRDAQVLAREHHLEQRRVGQAALRLQLLDEPFEREVLVVVRTQGRRPHARQEVAKPRGSREIGA
jgi:hypothetical protein